MMEGLRNFWPLSLLILILSISCCCNSSEARHHYQKTSAVVTGAVFCDTCFQGDLSKGGSYQISGATVAVECAQGSSRPVFYQEVKTDNQGNFKVQLPFSVSKNIKKIEGCTVKLVKSSEPYCAVASIATSSSIHLKDRKGRKHIFSAGFFSFKPLQPDLCNQQRSQLNSLEDLVNPQNPTTPDTEIPTLPNTPLLPNMPNLPPLPNLPLVPLLPPLPLTAPDTSVGPYKDSKVENGFVTQPQQIIPLIPPILPSPQGPVPLPPNPLMPAPLLPNPLQPPAPPLLPNPLQPPTPPSLLPPTPPLPSLPPLFPTPTPSPPVSSFPIPPIIPLPTTPSPPASSFPIPPIIPLPPTPLIPGIPPLQTKKVNP